MADEIEAAAGDPGAGVVEINVTPIKNFSEVQPRTWHKLEVDIPEDVILADRVGHTLINVPKRNEIFMLGGGNHFGDLTEVWKLENRDGALSCVLQTEFSSTFPGRYEFFAGVNEDNSQIWVFGGADLMSARNDVCALDLDTQVMLNPFVGTMESPHHNFNLPAPRTQGTSSCLLSKLNPVFSEEGSFELTLNLNCKYIKLNF